MFTKLFKTMAVMLLIVMLSSMTLTGAVAEMKSGMGPDEAMAPGDWAPIARGETHWFAFQYDKHGLDAKSTTASTVKVRLDNKPDNGAIFRVLTPEQAQLWRRDGTIQWIGSGAKNSNEKGDLFWTGSFNTSGTYYVIVQHSKQGTTPAWCQLSITGDGVTFQ